MTTVPLYNQAGQPHSLAAVARERLLVLAQGSGFPARHREARYNGPENLTQPERDTLYGLLQQGAGAMAALMHNSSTPVGPVLPDGSQCRQVLRPPGGPLPSFNGIEIYEHGQSRTYYLRTSTVNGLKLPQMEIMRYTFLVRAQGSARTSATTPQL